MDPASLDDDDLRLQSATGVRTKLHLANFTTAAGVVTATYRVNRTLLAGNTFSVRAIHEQVLDTDGAGNRPAAVATLELSAG